MGASCSAVSPCCSSVPRLSLRSAVGSSSLVVCGVGVVLVSSGDRVDAGASVVSRSVGEWVVSSGVSMMSCMSLSPGISMGVPVSGEVVWV
eukprot:7494176-Heterocapsa_arctica.AAC.1